MFYIILVKSMFFTLQIEDLFHAKLQKRSSRNRVRVDVPPKWLPFTAKPHAERFYFTPPPMLRVASPQPSVLSCSSSGYDFGDEDAGVIAHVGVVGSSCYAEAQARITLQGGRNKPSGGWVATATGLEDGRDADMSHSLSPA